MKKFFNFLKETWNWFIAIIIVVSGWFLIEHLFFKKSDKEKEILDNIENTQNKIDTLENNAKDKLEKEKQLEKEQDKIKEEIHSVYNNYEERIKAVAAKQEKIKKDSKDHKGNIDYINKKYGKNND